MRIAILGAGAWGTALATSLSQRHEVSLWARNPGACERLAKTRESPYLPGVTLPASVHIEPRLQAAASGASLVIVATATAGLAGTSRELASCRYEGPLLWACKGFEEGSLRLPHEILAVELPAAVAGALSGPSFALEVARAQPAALVVASSDATFAAATAAMLNSPRLRIYSTADVRGVEIGGAVKNVIAIAAGISDGLQLGRNARAALVTRGLAEIVRLGVALGGQAETFAGLAGLGDLVLTCTGDLSRNREVGMRLASGLSLDAALASLGHVAEGVRSARATRDIAARMNVEMPITQAVCEVLDGRASPMAAVERLLTRDPRPE
ncbi:MAG TPA: NAD(P)H-dependent glycerol-3-phosphate dehydrogenase [Usitatibacter sp.]|nr:NAD(P)H-dependent glycerol-3-phosphate dehydrogenase [Usitatibacter sp.]